MSQVRGPHERGAPRESHEPAPHALRQARRRLPLRAEFALAAPPTATILGVLALVETVTEQRLLFASLASSAFLIYLDPEHGANRLRALIGAQLLAAVVGWGAFALLGAGYVGAGSALVLTIVLMVWADLVHPPAVATAMSFALRAGDASNLALFVLALAITAVLVGLQRLATWTVIRARRVPPAPPPSTASSGASRRHDRSPT